MQNPAEGSKKEVGQRGKAREQARKRKPRRTSVGVNGEIVLDLLWRLGALTTPHLVRFSGISKTQAHEALKHLRENAICEQRDRKPHWFSRRGRAPAHYYLSRGNYGTGILEGAAAAGLEPRGKASVKAAMDRYALHGLPQHVVHAWLRNEFYSLLVRRAQSAGRREGLVPVGKLHGESFGGVPLRREDLALPSSGGVFPDGRFNVAFGSKNRGSYYERHYYVEAETRPRRKDAVGKINRYCGAWYDLSTRITMSGGDGMGRLVGAGFGPVIFVYPHAKDAQAVRDHTRKHFAQTAGGDPFSATSERYATLTDHWHRVGMMGQAPGAFFLFCGLDELASREVDPATGVEVVREPCYLPLEGHADAEEEDGRVALMDVALALRRAERGR